MRERVIRLRGVAVNNLQHLDLDLPHHRLIVVCGVSGSGKTSLALDTLYAEGQRRYIESFSAYTRQFLEQLDKPEAELIDGIPPAIAVTHSNPSRSNRATVGTSTEVNDYLRLLFARVGEIICPKCVRPVRRDTAESVADAISALAEGTRMMVGFAVDVPKGAAVGEWLKDLLDQGYLRAIVDGRTETIGPELAGRLQAGEQLTVVLDRLTAGAVAVERLRESLEGAFAAGSGTLVVLVEANGGAGSADHPSGGARSPSLVVEVDGKKWRVLNFSRALRCGECGDEFPELEPELFDFNRPLGACPGCEGFGNVVQTDMERVVPDPSKSIRDGAIAPWNTPAYEHELKELLALAKDYDVPVDVPFSKLTAEQREVIKEGVPERNFGGLAGFFRWLERRKYKMHLRVFLSRWRTYYPCPACGGARLQPWALAVHVGGKNFADVLQMEIRTAATFFDKLELAEWQQVIARPLVAEIRARLAYLMEVGVGYLTLERSLRTISNGEAQRVALTGTLGSSLVDMLYVLDEPSVGLHPSNVETLAAAIGRLRDRGNSVVVVEHEAEIIRGADQIVEIGPGAGDDGGRLVFQGRAGGDGSVPREQNGRLARRAAAAERRRAAADVARLGKVDRRVRK